MTNPILKLAGQTAIYGLSSIIGRLLNYILVPLYTLKFANPADYGVVSELYAWVAFLIVILAFGMETAYFRFTQDNHDEKSIFSSSLYVISSINLVFLILILLFHQSIADALLFSDHKEYIVLLSLIVVLDSFSAIPLARLRAKEKAIKFASIQLSSIGVNIGLNFLYFLFYFDSNNPSEGVFYILLINLISAAIKPLLLVKEYNGISIRPNWALMKKMALYSAPLVIAGFAGIINETLDRALLKYLLVNNHSLEYAEAQVGIYSACYKLALLVTIFLQAYRYAAEPFFFAQAKKENRNEVYSMVMNYFIGLVCFVFLFVSLNIEFFKYFIQNEAYWVGLDIVPILLLANICLGIYYNQSIWYKLSGKTKFGAYIALTGASITIALNIIYVPTYGYWACAWATLTVYIVQMILSYILGQKHFPIPYNLYKFFIYIGAALCLFFIAGKINIEGYYLKLGMNNLIILAFVLVFYLIEKNKLFEAKS